MNGSMTNRLKTSIPYNLAGSLLVASPGWEHELFGRAVCLVVHHSPERAIGVVLNRHLPLPLREFWQHLAPNRPIRHDARVHLGGPQAGPVVALHNRQELAEFTSADGVYFAAQIQNLKELVSSSESETQVKIFVGQADWGAGELEREFETGNWLPLPVSSKLVFADESEMWSRAMLGVGDLMVAHMTGAKVCPPEILMN
jgi:putative transcriptional regulator